MQKNVSKIRKSQFSSIKLAYNELKGTKDSMFSENNVNKHRTHKTITKALKVKDPVKPSDDVIVLSPKTLKDSE